MGKKLFAYGIGNPPYQEETKDTSDKHVYYKFMDAAYEVADKVELIHSAFILINFTGIFPRFRKGSAGMAGNAEL